MSMSLRSMLLTGMAATMGVSAIAAAQTTTPTSQAAPAAAPAGAAGNPRIAILDMQRVSQESKLGKSYAALLEALRKDIDSKGDAKQKELEAIDAAIKALRDEVDKQGSVLSPEAQERKNQEIVKKNRDRQAFIEDSQGELQRLRERAQAQATSLQGDFQNKLRPVIDQVAKEKGIDIIFDNQVALMFNKAYDVSADVVAKADALPITAPSAAPAAPPAGSSPAAKPGTTPPAAKPAVVPTPTPKPPQR